MKEEQHLAEYQQTRRELEAVGDELQRFQRKGEELLETTFSDIRQIVETFGETNEPLDNARQELELLENEFMGELEREKQKLWVREEEAEQIYREQLKEKEEC